LGAQRTELIELIESTFNIPKVEGPAHILTEVATEHQYVITDYDSFSQYDATIISGAATVVRNENKIHLIAQPTTEPIVLGITKNGYTSTKTIHTQELIRLALTNSEVSGGEWRYLDMNDNVITPYDTAYFNTHPVWGAIQDVMIDDQLMVKIPSFNCRVGTVGSGVHAGKSVWELSHKTLTDLSRHSAFWWAGDPLAQYWYGKYQASLTGGKLCSVPGVMPAVSRTIVQFSADAEARNVSGVTGFMQQSYHQISAIQWLYLLEHATMDSQAKTGRGRVDAANAALVDAADVAQATYRGMVGLWGNVWQWTVGMQIEAGRVWVWDSNQQLIDTGHTIPNPAAAWRYPTSFAVGTGTGFDLSHGFLAAANQTALAGATCQDGHYFTTDTARVLRCGGRWSNGSNAGLWAALGSSGAASVDPGISARLAKV
jgi:hypothetical protein